MCSVQKLLWRRKTTPALSPCYKVLWPAQDTLKYAEPEDWFFPVRESLGAALLMNGENVGAEKVFREDLNYHPRNPRSLFGLQQALKAQGKEYDAGFVQKQLHSSWKGGSTQLKLDDL